MNAPATVQPSRSFSWRRVFGWSAGGLAALVVAAALAGWLALRGSLPQLEGEATLPGLGAAVTVQRDAAGTPTVVASSREDIAYALGYLHGQERFFQMDLQRRAPAGELAALLGPKMIDTDRKFRPHGLRAVARQVVAAATPAEQRLLEAYTVGVNTGLAALRVRPWEYLLLQQPPRPWLAEDTILTAHAMFLTLQDSDGSFERQRAAIHATTPGLEDFLYSPPGDWQAPLFGLPLPSVPVPVEALQAALAAAPPAAKQASLAVDPSGLLAALSGEGAAAGVAVVGSNNWALAGKHTASGGALVADDMHLAIRVPNIWYRVRLETRDAAGALQSAVTGVSLPGSPLVVSGSNGRIAWGFTNSNIDSTDSVVLVPDPAQADHYLTANGTKALQKREEVLEVRGGKPVTLEVVTSEFGPVLGHDADGRAVAVQWVPHFVGGTNSRPFR
jgi:penicillin amidase